eukprot:12072774-Alexandrium_andersonii.AAC.1
MGLTAASVFPDVAEAEGRAARSTLRPTRVLRALHRRVPGGQGLGAKGVAECLRAGPDDTRVLAARAPRLARGRGQGGGWALADAEGLELEGPLGALGARGRLLPRLRTRVDK